MSHPNLFAILKKVLSRPIAFHRIFATVAGGATEGLFLSQAYYWSQHVDERFEGWFYKTRTEWENETALSRREQEKARIALRALGILHEELKGVPAKLFYKVDCDRLYELICEKSSSGASKTATNQQQQQLAINDQLEGQKRPTRMSEMTNKPATNGQLSISTEINTKINSEKEEIPPTPDENLPVIVENFPEPIPDVTPEFSVSEQNFVTPVLTVEAEPENLTFDLVKQSEALIPHSPAPLTAIERYSKAYSGRRHGGSLPDADLQKWAGLVIGEAVRDYRTSGVILSGKFSPNQDDINPDFALFVAVKNKKPGQANDPLTYGLNIIRKREREPETWGDLSRWVAEWKMSRAIGQNVSIGAEVERQRQRDEWENALNQPVYGAKTNVG